MSSLGDLGEVKAIKRLVANLSNREDVRTGPGDDAAVVSGHAEYDLVLTSDPLIEGTHFLPDDPAESVGHKALGRTLSDIAAMGGEPMWTLVNVVAPGSMDMERLESAYRGINTLAERYGVAVVGGDVAEGPGFQLHVFTVGQVPPGGALLRSGAKEGDRIYVTGALGGSREGKHLTFEPRIEEALWLREEGWPHAMMDLSDGLATDLRHLMEASGVGATLKQASIPVSPDAQSDNPLVQALMDGEDFELLFTVPEKRVRSFESSWKETFELSCTCIGHMGGDPGVFTLVDGEGMPRLFEGGGFEHFRS